MCVSQAINNILLLFAEITKTVIKASMVFLVTPFLKLVLGFNLGKAVSGGENYGQCMQIKRMQKACLIFVLSY